jgi:hypothetical protein
MVIQVVQKCYGIAIGLKYLQVLIGELNVVVRDRNRYNVSIRCFFLFLFRGSSGTAPAWGKFAFFRRALASTLRSCGLQHAAARLPVVLASASCPWIYRSRLPFGSNPLGNCDGG